MMDDEDLKRVAEAATPGPWVSFDRDTASNIYSAGNDGSLLAVCHSYTTDVSPKRPNAERRKANATYIATFDPPTVLSLLSRLSAAADRERVLVEALRPFERAFRVAVEEMPGDVQAVQIMRSRTGFAHFEAAARALTQEPTR